MAILWKVEHEAIPHTNISGPSYLGSPQKLYIIYETLFLICINWFPHIAGRVITLSVPAFFFGHCQARKRRVDAMMAMSGF